jgi:hypothetical protein
VENQSFTSSAELSALLSNGLLNHWEKSSDELNILGKRKFKSAQSSSRLFFKEKRNKLVMCHICIIHWHALHTETHDHYINRWTGRSLIRSSVEVQVQALEPAEVFLLTISDGNSDKASDQRWAYKTHSLCGALHQLLYSATVFYLVLAYHVCSSSTHMLSEEHWTSVEQSSPWKNSWS